MGKAGGKGGGVDNQVFIILLFLLQDTDYHNVYSGCKFGPSSSTSNPIVPPQTGTEDTISQFLKKDAQQFILADVEEEPRPLQYWQTDDASSLEKHSRALDLLVCN